MVVLAPRSPPEKNMSPAVYVCLCEHKCHLSEDVRICSSVKWEGDALTSAEVLSLEVVHAACTPLGGPRAGSPLSLMGDAPRDRLGPGTCQPSAVLADASAACFAASLPSAPALETCRGCRPTRAMESPRPVSRYRAIPVAMRVPNSSLSRDCSLLCCLMRWRLACSRL